MKKKRKPKFKRNDLVIISGEVDSDGTILVVDKIYTGYEGNFSYHCFTDNERLSYPQSVLTLLERGGGNAKNERKIRDSFNRANNVIEWMNDSIRQVKVIVNKQFNSPIYPEAWFDNSTKTKR